MKSASELRAEAAAYLLGWSDTAVIDAAARTDHAARAGGDNRTANENV